MGKKFTIQVCSFQFDMIQTPLSPQAYEYWRGKTNREKEEYVIETLLCYKKSGALR